MKWQPIKTAPLDGDYVIVAEAGDDLAYIARSDGVFGWLTEIGGEEVALEPTHWMPLPTPPQRP